MSYISINVLMDKLTRHPLLKDIPMETVVDYTMDFIRIVGIPPIFFDKTAIIHIEDYKGLLPCDYYEMRQVRTMDGEYFRYTTDTFHMSPNKPSSGMITEGRVVVYADNYDKDGKVRIENTLHATKAITKSPLTYKIQGDCIFTSIPCGDIEIAYMALPVNEEGYPLLPDNSVFMRALETYVKVQWFTILFDTGKLQPQILQNAQQQYAWAVGQAQAELILPTIDQMQTITAMWNRLLPDINNDFQHGFIHEGTQERFKTH